MQISSSLSGISAYSSMSAAYGSKNADDMDTKLATDIMSAKDTDKSGTLSASELGVSQSNVAEYDTDGDGVVSAAELAAGLKAKREQMQASMQNKMTQDGQMGMLQASMGQGVDAGQMASQMAQNIFTQKDADKSGGLSASELGVSDDQLKKIDTDGDGQVSQDELTAALKANRESGGAGRAHHHHHKAAATGESDQTEQTDSTGQTSQTGQTTADINNLISGLFSNSASTGTTASASSDGASLTGSLADYMLRQKATSAYQNVDQLISNLFANSDQAAQSVSATA